MKYSVKIDDHIYEVEIQNLQAQPVIALVDGQEVEVWLQNSIPGHLALAKQEATTGKPPTSPTLVGKGQVPGSADEKSVVAPIPGVIEKILVNEGDAVSYGQELCIIEAMKMRNAIRAARAGKIASILIASGQTVNHHDVIMEYAD
jgi:biotin carboxyl carrier protein